MSRHPRGFYVILLSALAGLAVIGAMLVICGCAKAQPGFCVMVRAGLAYVDAQLEGGGGPDADEFRDRIAPVLAAKGMEGILGQAQDIWDRIPTEQKLQAAKKLLEYLDGLYCGPNADPERAADPSDKAGVLHILLSYMRTGDGR